MKKFFLFGLVLSSLSQAEIIQDRIHSIDNGLVKFANGRVAFIDQQDLDLSTDDYVKANVDERSSLVSFAKITGPTSFKDLSLQNETLPAPFTPTIVSGMSEAWNIFYRSNPNYKRISECSDRAHIWAHEEFKNNGIKSEKLFVFFTASYINSVRFKWWFHVAPMYTIEEGGNIQKMVMDYRFTDRPMTIKEWTDRFVYTKRECKVTEKFSEYDVNPQTENCYLMTRSMHYRIPADIVAEEKNGFYKTSSSESEIKTSYNFAFKK
jgi:hypothetical protein